MCPHKAGNTFASVATDAPMFIHFQQVACYHTQQKVAYQNLTSSCILLCKTNCNGLRKPVATRTSFQLHHAAKHDERRLPHLIT